jgi:aspartyl-tRNA(Asn)/glutamyl-tRNA(Gln) amidotransferase subunit C
MTIEAKDVRWISKLANISVPEEEIETIGKDLNFILHWIDQLNEVDTSDIDLLDPAGRSAPEREDSVQPAPGVDSILANAPDSVDSWFAVPKIIS